MPENSVEFFPGDLVKLKEPVDSLWKRGPTFPQWKRGKYQRMCQLAGLGNDVIAYLNTGDVAIVIAVDGDQAFVFPSQGKRGWIYVGDIEMVSRRGAGREAT